MWPVARRIIDSNEAGFKHLGTTKSGTPVEVCGEVLRSELTSGTRVLLYSDFNRGETEKMGFAKLHSFQSYLYKRIFSAPNVKITVVPHGNFVRFRE